MSHRNAVYRGRRAEHINETSDDMNIGPRIDFGDGLLFRVNWGDPELIIDPTDDEWFGASEMLNPLPGVEIDEETGEGWLFRGSRYAQSRSEQ